MLLPLPLPTFYATIVLFWLPLIFNFAIITEHILLKIKEVIFTILTYLSAVFFYLVDCPCFDFSASADCAEVIQLTTSQHIFAQTRHCQDGCLDPQYLHVWVCFIGDV